MENFTTEEIMQVLMAAFQEVHLAKTGKTQKEAAPKTRQPDKDQLVKRQTESNNNNNNSERNDLSHSGLDFELEVSTLRIAALNSMKTRSHPAPFYVDRDAPPKSPTYLNRCELLRHQLDFELDNIATLRTAALENMKTRSCAASGLANSKTTRPIKLQRHKEPEPQPANLPQIVNTQQATDDFLKVTREHCLELRRKIRNNQQALAQEGENYNYLRKFRVWRKTLNFDDDSDEN